MVSCTPLLHPCLQIICQPFLHPSCLQKNYNLLAVNVFMALTGMYQLQRKIRWDLEHPKTAGEAEAAVPAAVKAA